ncbi:MAG: hypothetical protein IPO95_13925 [Rhodanobacteraceae bacterium]|nr:hypothetical protein [Rhodanobacteraceae bacterium]MBL0039720.1 hypothetical protein [Xanthomonadales bacterium]MBP7623512.1 hypothetical protein [Xanthomonadales bacterium]
MATGIGKSRTHKKNQMVLSNHLIEPAVAGGGSLGAIVGYCRRYSEQLMDEE